MHCDIEVHWHISHYCNFACPYCFCGKEHRDVFRGIQDVPRIIEGFDRFGLTCQINISGGEPFLYKDFVGLCRRLTEKHRICVNTNLTHNDVYRFADEIDPRRVRYLNCSLHSGIRKKMKLVEDFIGKFNLLREKGFQAFATQVLYPPDFKTFDKDYGYLKSRGIILRPKLFRGMYNLFGLSDAWVPRRGRRFLKRLYPNSFSGREREKILFWVEQSRQDGGDPRGFDDDTGEGRMLNVGLDRFFIDGLPCYKGQLCRAGRDYVRMSPEGEVYRCHGGIHRLGNMFSEEGVQLLGTAEPCTFDSCMCHYLGSSYLVTGARDSERVPLSGPAGCR